MVAYLIGGFFVVTIALAFGQYILHKRGYWQAFMAAGFGALGVAGLYLVGGYDEECAYLMAVAMLAFSFSMIVSTKKE